MSTHSIVSYATLDHADDDVFIGAEAAALLPAQLEFPASMSTSTRLKQWRGQPIPPLPPLPPRPRLRRRAIPPPPDWIWTRPLPPPPPPRRFRRKQQRFQGLLPPTRRRKELQNRQFFFQKPGRPDWFPPPISPYKPASSFKNRNLPDPGASQPQPAKPEVPDHQALPVPVPIWSYGFVKQNLFKTPPPKKNQKPAQPEKVRGLKPKPPEKVPSWDDLAPAPDYPTPPRTRRKGLPNWQIGTGRPDWFPPPINPDEQTFPMNNRQNVDKPKDPPLKPQPSKPKKDPPLQPPPPAKPEKKPPPQPKPPAKPDKVPAPRPQPTEKIPTFDDLPLYARYPSIYDYPNIPIWNRQDRPKDPNLQPRPPAIPGRLEEIGRGTWFNIPPLPDYPTRPPTRRKGLPYWQIGENPGRPDWFPPPIYPDEPTFPMKRQIGEIPRRPDWFPPPIYPDEPLFPMKSSRKKQWFLDQVSGIADDVADWGKGVINDGIDDIEGAIDSVADAIESSEDNSEEQNNESNENGEETISSNESKEKSEENTSSEESKEKGKSKDAGPL